MAVDKNLGTVTAYGYAKDKGFVGTEEEFAELMASYAEVAEEAEGYSEDSEAYAIGKRKGVDVVNGDSAYHNNSKYYSEGASLSASSANTDALKSEGYAVGKQNGSDVGSGTYFHNNAKYYSEQSANSATTASNKAGEASESAGDALGYKNNASASATSASNNALKSEGFAVGQQNGTNVSSGTYYQNNAKYYKEQAATKAGDASASATSSSTNALKSEGFAVGQQNGTDVASGSPYYENNAKYYAEQAEASAQSLTVDSVLSTSSTNPVQNKVITTELNNKANTDGLYENFTSGNSLQLVSNVKLEDQDPYTFRTSGGSLEIGDRENDKLVGCSYPWNQQANPQNYYTYESTKNGITRTVVQQNGKNIFHFSGTKNSNEPDSNIYNVLTNSGCIDGHIYYMATTMPNKYYAISYTDFDSKGGGAIITKCKQTRSNYLLKLAMKPVMADGVTVDDYVDFVMCDLTLNFGSTIADYIYSLESSNAGDGVAFFKKYFPKDYYPYCAESLSSVNASAHRMTGFNQTSVNPTLAMFYDNNGVLGSRTSNSYAALTIKVRCVPSTVYCITLPHVASRVSIYPYYFDADKNFISKGETVPLQQATNYCVTVTTPPNAFYLSFCIYRVAELTNTEMSECNINLHWDGERDGEYEPYSLHNYPLNNDVVLRGQPTLVNGQIVCDGDVYHADGTVDRNWYEVDLGSLTYRYLSSSKAFLSDHGLADHKASTVWGIEYIPDVRASGYTPQLWGDISADVVDMAISAYDEQVRISDSRYTDPSAFKTAMSGKKLVYKLATPTTESADPFQDPQVVDNWGTEEYVVTSQNGVDIPVGHETKYPLDVLAKIEVAPDSPDSDGDYLMHRENGENSYTAFIKELPTLPSEDGNYVLKCSVSGSTKTLSWESQS